MQGQSELVHDSAADGYKMYALHLFSVLLYKTNRGFKLLPSKL
jgi:hypothetical protein